MRSDQAERIDELRAQLEGGAISVEEFQARTTDILLDSGPSTTESNPVPDDNPPPSPIHVWNGDAWVLPAAHEIKMLATLENSDDISDESLNETRQIVEERLVEQEAAAAEAGE